MASSSGIKHSRVKNPSNQPNGNLLQSPKHKQRYSENVDNHRIISSKYLYWDYFVGCRKMTFVDLLNNLGLKKLVSLKGFSSPKVIRAFYTTLEYNVRGNILYAEIRGIKIELSEEKLADVLGIPPPGWMTSISLTIIHRGEGWGLQDDRYRGSLYWSGNYGQ